MTETYRITLTPVDKYFFGGDMTFQIKTADNQFNEQFSSYIIQSLMFPQQTTLLGMLRFLVLRHSGKEVFDNGEIINKDKAAERIGRQSFGVTFNHEENEFGIIKGLSHVRILKKDKATKKETELEFAPLTQGLDWNAPITGWFGFQQKKVPDVCGYKAKDGLGEPQLTDGKLSYPISSIFVEDRRIGINRSSKTGKSEDDGLFKQVSYRFKNTNEVSYCFVFNVKMDGFELEQYDGEMVTIGGDNTQFIMGVNKINDANATSFSKGGDTITLLSPAFILREEAQLATFAITRLMPFRFLETSIETKSYHILNKEVKRSRKYELYAPSSIFFFEDEDKGKMEEFVKRLELKKEFRQIGYNAYQIN